ncbi:HpcH/HpaI aldolase/citrate lyase family protein [Rhodococcus jostii]|uniref:Citrate lyase subunit beta / citryl-CoA lyase n=1 Tax=Rhodococcus jostii TaxID=132919 RepID=A0A1H4JBM5_RHOJO|nr:CoA ester lyase [Rhodococcus jostii]SEB43734.1 citrate lyase subunit beta / citryl-CoA lyase [Rhodococcus jostii]
MSLSAPATSRRVSSEFARSWLLVNTTRRDRLEDAQRSAADQIVLDIEDAVAPQHKPEARATVVRWLEREEAWVRINDHSTSFWSDDVDQLKGLPGLTGVMLAKTESAEQVTETFDRLGGTTPVIGLIESALGIEESPRIAATRGTFRLAFGSGDYRRDTGTSDNDLAMAYPRSRLVVASRLGRLPGPIDGPMLGSSRRLLSKRTTTAVGLGLTGKLCLDTAQAPTINKIVSPSSSETAWATEFLEDFDSRGGTIRDGSDLPLLKRAQKVTRLSAVFNSDPNGRQSELE